MYLKFLQTQVRSSFRIAQKLSTAIPESFNFGATSSEFNGTKSMINVQGVQVKKKSKGGRPKKPGHALQYY